MITIFKVTVCVGSHNAVTRLCEGEEALKEALREFKSRYALSYGLQGVSRIELVAATPIDVTGTYL